MVVFSTNEKPSYPNPKNEQIYKEIACLAWHTASGDTKPVLIKVQDEDGIIQEINKIHVKRKEDKLYCGIPSVEYICEVMTNGFTVDIMLSYYPERQKWFMVQKKYMSDIESLTQMAYDSRANS